MSLEDKILRELLTDKPNDEILFKQYKLYVKMANEVSNRRYKTNKFYITLISLFITAFSIIISITHELILSFIPLIAIIIMSYVWMKNIESYSTLNRGKFDVINKIEEQLPAKGFSIEWELLELYHYNELTKIEKKIPKIILIIATVIVIILFVLFIQKGCCIF